VSAFSRADDVLRRGVTGRVFPGAAAEFGTADAVTWQGAVGSLTYEPGATPASHDTVFDLASLTKVIVTTNVAMRLVEDARLLLDAPVRRYDLRWCADDRSAVTVRDLLEHASGLPSWAPLFRTHEGRQAMRSAVATTPLAYAPRSQSVYSDLGFILLGCIIEDIGGRSLDRQFQDMAAGWAPTGAGDLPLVFNPPISWRPRIAPTRFSERRGRLLVGEVDDDNACALGGVAGHSGVFGTAAAVGVVARVLLRALSGDRDAERRLATRDTLMLFLSESTVPGSSRALGWDLMRTTSSCGSRMSAAAFGHTGFTGTSLWIDPERGVYTVLLANRVHPDARPNDAMQDVRRAFHDALMEGHEA
jgi:CubicO group peptidase (beta-lactamase class C family)